MPRPPGPTRRPQPLAVATVVLALTVPAAPTYTQTLDEARSLHRSGDLRAAAEAYAAVASALADDDPAAAAIAHNNRCVVLKDLGVLPSARQSCEAALALRRGLDDPRRLARSLNNYGLVLQPLGELSASEAAYREALEINRTLDELESEVINLSNLSLVLEEAGRYGEALAAVRAARTLSESEEDTSPWASYRAQIARINESVVLEKLGAYREALELYEQVDPEQLDPRGRAGAHLNRGVMLRNLGDPQRARDAFVRASEIFAEIQDPGAVANAWINIGRAELDLSQTEAAEQAFTRAIALARESGDRREEIEATLRSGFSSLETGELERARSTFESALGLSTDSQAPEGLWTALYGLGRASQASGDLEAARRRFEASLETIESTREEIHGSMFRSGFLVENRPVYAAVIGTLTAPDARSKEQIATAYLWSQRAKSRALLELLGNGGSTILPQTAAQVSELLGDRTLLEIFVGPEETLVFRLDSEGIEVWSAGSTPELEVMVSEVAQATRRGRASDLAEDLGRRVWGPLGGSDPPDVLVVAPDLFFHNLPFAVLPWPGLGGDLAVDHVAIGELPSGSALARARRTPAPSAPRFVGFADPVLDPLQAPELSADRTLWTALDGARREVQKIGNRFPDSAILRLGPTATESSFLATLRGRGARWVHLATHAVAAATPQQGAAVLLTPDEANDGVLRPSEIASYDLPSDLTVLAGCQTAVGGLESGRSFASLTGAFLVSGSRHIVATRWDIGDQAAAVLSDQLYHHLERGVDPAEALRRAQVALREDPGWNRPELWAAYVLVGEPSTPQRPLPLAILLAVAIGGIIGLVWWVSRGGRSSFGLRE